MKHYYNGEWVSQYIENAVTVSMDDFDRLVCGRNKGLVLASNSEGYPILTNPYTGEEYTGDWRDFDITQEAEHIEMMRVQGLREEMELKKNRLNKTDWIIGKCIDYIAKNGLDMNKLNEVMWEKYPDIMTEREASRAAYNELESQI